MGLESEKTQVEVWSPGNALPRMLGSLRGHGAGQRARWEDVGRGDYLVQGGRFSLLN